MTVFTFIFTMLPTMVLIGLVVVISSMCERCTHLTWGRRCSHCGKWQ